MVIFMVIKWNQDLSTPSSRQEKLESPSPSGGLSDSNYQIDQVERQVRLLEPWGVSKLCCEGGLRCETGLRKPGQLKAQRQ